MGLDRFPFGEKLAPSRHNVSVVCVRKNPQKNGGVADLCYVDDGDILCHPILMPTFLQEFDVANAKVGAEPTENRSHPQSERPG